MSVGVAATVADGEVVRAAEGEAVEAVKAEAVKVEAAEAAPCTCHVSQTFDKESNTHSTHTRQQ